MIGSWNVRTLLDKGSRGPQNSRFLQLKHELERYKLDLLGLSEGIWWTSGDYSSPSSGYVLLFSGKASGGTREYGDDYRRARNCLLDVRNRWGTDIEL